MSVLTEEIPTLSIEALRAGSDDAMAELHALMLRAARFELHRRRQLPYDDAEDLAAQAANDAMVALLGKLDTFRGQSRFTTWAYKFALLEAGVKARRRAWQDREVPLEDTRLRRPPARPPQQTVEDAELLRAVRDAMRTELTAPPARGVHRARAQRRADRRARRPARLHARGAVQDAARRPPQAARGDRR